MEPRLKKERVEKLRKQIMESEKLQEFTDKLTDTRPRAEREADAEAKKKTFKEYGKGPYGDGEEGSSLTRRYVREAEEAKKRNTITNSKQGENNEYDEKNK